MLNSHPDDKYVPCIGLLCYLLSVRNPLAECSEADPIFPCASSCICFCLSCDRIGQCRPKAPKGELCISMTFGCKLVETFIGCTSVSIDCCTDSRQSLPCNGNLIPQAVGLFCFICFYNGEQKMVFGKKFSELNSAPVPTNVN